AVEQSDASGAGGHIAAATEAPAPKEKVKMETGTVLLKRFKVEGELGQGGFGQIYSVRDLETQKEYALKWQVTGDGRRIKLEMTVLLQLRAKRHVPTIIASGTHMEKGYIIIQALGKNLSMVRREMPHRRLSDGTVYRVAEQMLRALREVHEIGYLHRDVKPNNMCIGLKDLTRIYLIDFGMARQYTTTSGRVRKARDMVGFRGTPRYVAKQVHQRIEQGPGGDLVSLVYSLIEMHTGSLPWGKTNDADEMKKNKQEISLDKLCEKMAKPFQELTSNIMGLDYEDFPDYDYLLGKVKECFWPGFDPNELFDWEYREAEKQAIERTQKNPQDPCRTIRIPPLIIDPTKAHIPGKNVPVTHLLVNNVDLKYAFRISTSRVDYQCKPHFGFIGPREQCKLVIMVQKSTSASRLDSTCDSTPNEGFHIYYCVVPPGKENLDPREVIRKNPKKAKI
ncbi:hypothetical protein PFISCL1PPCAC_9441, partial [Pristionchus fissidentatus]